MTEKQLSFINALLDQKFFTQDHADELAYHLELRSGKTQGFVIDLDNLEALSARSASALIDALKAAPSKVAAAAREEKKAAAFSRYEKMIEWAKDHGVKVRARMKATTVRQMIVDAGLELPAEFA